MLSKSKQLDGFAKNAYNIYWVGKMRINFCSEYAKLTSDN